MGAWLTARLPVPCGTARCAAERRCDDFFRRCSVTLSVYRPMRRRSGAARAPLELRSEHVQNQRSLTICAQCTLGCARRGTPQTLPAYRWRPGRKARPCSLGSRHGALGAITASLRRCGESAEGSSRMGAFGCGVCVCVLRARAAAMRDSRSQAGRVSNVSLLPLGEAGLKHELACTMRAPANTRWHLGLVRLDTGLCVLQCCSWAEAVDWTCLQF